MATIKMRLTQERTAYAAGLGIALILLAQAMQLDAWSILGPGPGLFAQGATAFTAGVALLLLVSPGAGAARKAAADDPPAGAVERRMFGAYCLAMLFLGVAATYLGFIVTSLLLAAGLTFWAEGRNWRATAIFGAICGAVGVAGFGHLLGASIPASLLDRLLLQLFR
jgi:Tripartite tricarboxylate transporter TctB family